MSFQIVEHHLLDLTSRALAPIAKLHQLLCDRFRYASDERFVHVYANLAGPASGGKLLATIGGATQSLSVAGNKVGLILDIASLAAGDYTLNCRFDGQPSEQAAFTKLAPAAQAGNHPDASPSVAFPAAGIPLALPNITPAAEGGSAFGTHALVPVPRGTSPAEIAKLRVHENGVEENGAVISSQTEVVGAWDGVGSPRWLHVFFTAKWDKGVPRQYRLRPTGAPQPADGVVVHDADAGLTVTTPQARIEIARPFDGIRINGAAPALQHLIDENGKRWTMGRDAKIIVETQGPALAVVKITGGFQGADGIAGPWRFTTRIRVAKDSPLIRFEHAFEWSGNAVDAPRIADLAFGIPLADASQYALGLDGRPRRGRCLPRRRRSSIKSATIARAAASPAGSATAGSPWRGRNPPS